MELPCDHGGDKMKVRWNHRLIAGLMVAAMACVTGCNIMAWPYFFMPGEHTIDPKCKLASEDKEKSVKVVILSSSGLELRPEFLRTDRELSRLLAVRLGEAFKHNKEKVTIVPTSHVEK